MGFSILRAKQLLGEIFPPVSRARFVALTLSFLCNIAVLSTELPLLKPDERWGYLLLKGGFSLALFLLGVYIRFNPHKAWPNYAVAFAFFGVCYTSFFYRPLYSVGLFEHFAMYSYAFPVVEGFFITFAVLSYLAFGAAHQLIWPNLPDAQYHLDLTDFQHINVQFLLIVLFFYFFFVRARRYRAETERRLSVIGRNASNIAHDLKGMIMGPALYLDRLMELVGQDKEASQEVKELVDLTTLQFKEIEQLMVSFNQLCLAERTQVSQFSAAEVIGSAKKVLWKSARTFSIEVSGDRAITGERALFLSYAFNVMTNALQSLKHKSEGGRILWTISENEITCWDDGGGFSDEALSAIRAARPFSSREGGSGLGIPVIIQSAKQLGGTVSFSNRDGGALVTLKLLS